VSWTFVRPADPSVLAGRPLLDLGVGDGQTIAALARDGLVVGVERSASALAAAGRVGRARLIRGRAQAVPLGGASVATVLAADLFHHISDGDLAIVLDEVARVLKPGGRLVAWWYETPAHPAPDAPAFPRTFEQVAATARAQGSLDDVSALSLEVMLPSGPRTIGLTARRP
jgi:SAM-dependent methyltransferase